MPEQKWRSNQILPNAASDQGLHCLLLIQQLSDKNGGIQILG